jgi:hypothetical protein
MKSILKLTLLFTGIFAALSIFQRVPTINGLFAALIVAACFAPSMWTPSAVLRATLSATEILMDTIDAFHTMVPQLTAFSTDFKAEKAVKDQQIIAHIAGLPTVQDYDATTGFKANAATAQSLLTDVPVTLNRLKHVPVKVAYLTQLATRKNLYQEAIRNQAYVIGKSIVDYALSLYLAANISTKKVYATADSDLDALEDIRSAMNTNKALSVGRFGIVNTAVAAAMQLDSRIASSDYYAILNGNSGYRTFQGVAGFENIWEYPDLPSNAEALTGVFGDRRAVTVAARLPSVDDLAKVLGLPQIAKFEVVQDDRSGFPLLGIAWQEAGTFDVYVTLATLYGASVGKQGGAAGDILDYAGARLATA